MRRFSSGSSLSAPPDPGTHGTFWLRMTLTDGEELEGLAANDRSLVGGAGLLLTPPDTRSNTQRIFVPRLAIQTLEVVSLIGAASRRARLIRQHHGESVEVRIHLVDASQMRLDQFDGRNCAGAG